MSDLISNFVNQITSRGIITDMATKAGSLADTITGLVQAKRAGEAYTSALRNYTEDGSRENLLALYEAAAPVGKFDQIKTTIAEMDSLAQKNQLQRNMEYYYGVLSGNTPTTIGDLEKDALANENDGDIAEAKQLRHLAQQLREGKEKEFLSYIGGMSGLLEGGPEALQNVRDMNADRIAQEKAATEQIMSSAQIFKTMQELQVEDPEERARLGEVMEGMPLSYGKELSKLISIAGTTPDKSSPEFIKLVNTLRTEYFDDTVGFRANDAVKAKMSASLAQDTAQGDVGAIFLFMKMLDEESVVRESEFRTASGMGSLVDYFRNLADGWVTGQRLQSGQKANFEKLTSAFYNVSKEKRKLIDDRMRKNTTFFGVPENLVFLDYETTEEAPATGETEYIRTQETIFVPAEVPEEVKKDSGEVRILNLFEE